MKKTAHDTHTGGELRRSSAPPVFRWATSALFERDAGVPVRERRRRRREMQPSARRCAGWQVEHLGRRGHPQVAIQHVERVGDDHGLGAGAFRRGVDAGRAGRAGRSTGDLRRLIDRRRLLGVCDTSVGNAVTCVLS
jgi:hypothetical protein